MIRKFEIVLVLVAIVLLTLFSASFANPVSTNRYEQQTAFYGRDILIKPSTTVVSTVLPDSTDDASNLDAYFWGVPSFSHQ